MEPTKCSRNWSQHLRKTFDPDCVVRISHLGKFFPLNGHYGSLYRLIKGKLLGNNSDSQTFAALKDINIEIRRGEKVGLIGNNGAGKSSLLKLIAGLYLPSNGELYVNGDVTFLAGLGLGMVDELSVEENIYLYGAIFGLEREKIKQSLDEIIEWAELQDFVRAKLKTLSTGMRTRLAFSTTRHIEADIVLMDEALSAGDRNFKKKCEDVFESYKNNSRTFLFASHDIEFVKKFCSKTLWLHKGEQMAFGDTDLVLQEYNGAK
ncbi:MAG: ABC transporter ATP-binding protein [Deltaproteobacteria bacterium]|nr:MAG: ABC transporter ATP-binding protein [Deltaproteobacteria bacterium]